MKGTAKPKAVIKEPKAFTAAKNAVTVHLKQPASKEIIVRFQWKIV